MQIVICPILTSNTETFVMIILSQLLKLSNEWFWQYFLEQVNVKKSSKRSSMITRNHPVLLSIQDHKSASLSFIRPKWRTKALSNEWPDPINSGRLTFQISSCAQRQTIKTEICFLRRMTLNVSNPQSVRKELTCTLKIYGHWTCYILSW